MPENYVNPALEINEILDRLRSQRLIINEPQKAKHRLKTVSLHRLSAYFDHFQLSKSAKEFKPHTTFDDIWQLYVFDRELRLLISDALERIEVTFRTAISDTMSRRYNPYWFLDIQNFKNKNIYNQFLLQIKEICQRKHEPAIRHYYAKYHNPKYPPSWIIIESLSFGSCTSAFNNLKKLEDRKKICAIFSYHPTAIGSWMDALRYVRNLCAHHARLWNRWFIISPKLTYLYGKNFGRENTFYAQIIVMDKLIKAISPGSTWKDRLNKLFLKYHVIPYEKMGFQKNWKDDLFWKE